MPVLIGKWPKPENGTDWTVKSTKKPDSADGPIGNHSLPSWPIGSREPCNSGSLVVETRSGTSWYWKGQKLTSGSRQLKFRCMRVGTSRCIGFADFRQTASLCCARQSERSDRLHGNWAGSLHWRGRRKEPWRVEPPTRVAEERPWIWGGGMACCSLQFGTKQFTYRKISKVFCLICAPINRSIRAKKDMDVQYEEETMYWCNFIIQRVISYIF